MASGFEFDASPDDSMWIEECTAEEIVELIHNPYQWLKRVNEKNDESYRVIGKSYTSRILADYFVLSLSLYPSRLSIAPPASLQAEAREGDPDLAKHYTVEGIDKTCVLTVRPSPNAEGHSLIDKWKSHWEVWMTEDENRPWLVQIDEGNRLGYGHLQLSDKGESPEDRADKVAAFFFLAGNPNHKYPSDQDLHGTSYINLINRRRAYMGKPPEDVGKSRFNDLSPDQILQINFIYTGKRRDVDFPKPKPHGSTSADQFGVEDATAGPESGRSATAGDDTACENQIGVVDSSGQVTTTDVIVKWYPAR